MDIHTTLVWVELILAALTLASVTLITAPYGRHLRAGFGPMIPARAGWVIMELPSVLVFAVVFFLGDHRLELVPLILLALWQLHYVNRTFIYPFRLRGGRRMPIVVALSGCAFTSLNAYINARFISHIGSYADTWLTDPRFIAGAAVMLTGLAINLRADSFLRSLRTPGESSYKIPRGGLYERISCPNYLGEILEWLGWALATWSLAGLAFAVYTIANLGPRAISHHRWYQREFDDYPEDRKALIPYLL